MFCTKCLCDAEIVSITNAEKDNLKTYGISSDKISVLSYGKERPVDAGSSP